MKKHPKTLPSILVAIFVLISVSSFFALIYCIWMTAFSVGWGGGDITMFEIIWEWKGFILLSVYAGISSAGLLKCKPFGLIFGYTIPFLLISYLVYGLSTYFKEGALPFESGDLIAILVFLVIFAFFLIGLIKMQNSMQKLRAVGYIISVTLTIVLVLSFRFLFV